MRARHILSAGELAIVVALGRIDIEYVTRYLRNPAPSMTPRLLRRFGAEIGGRARVKGALSVDNILRSDGYRGDLGNLRIGENAYVGEAVYIDLAEQVDVGDDSMVSAGCSLLTHLNVHRSPYLASRFPARSEPVRIGPGAWLGARVTVTPGVTVGDAAVVAAGAVVVDDVPARTVVAGVPARHVRDV